MAYKTEIQVKVDGLSQVKKLEETLTRVNSLTTRINKQAASKIVDIGRTNAETKALSNLNRELERTIALQGKASRSGGGGKPGGGGGGGKPGGGGGGGKPGGGVNRAESVALGVGFPLLFGGGAGQVLGGLAGSFVGSGFGGQILGSAIGGQLEDALRRIQEIDKATQNLDMDALAESAIVVNAELRETVQNLVDMGESQRAVEVAAAAVSMQTGVLPESVRDASSAVTLLSNIWDELVGRVSGLLSLVGTPLVSALTLVLKLVSEGVKGINFFVNLIGLAIKRFVELIRFFPGGEKLLQGIADAMGGVDEAAESRLVTLRQTGTELEKELGREKEIFAIEQRRAAGTTAAAKLNNAQVSRDVDLAKLRQATEDKILAKRLEFAGVTDHVGKVERDYQIVLINQSAEIEKQRILKKYSLDETAAGLQRQKEIEKEMFEMRVNDSKIAQAGIQTQLDTIANEEKIFQLRSQTAAATVELERARFDAQLSTLQLQEAGLQRELKNLQRKEIRYGRQLELIDQIAENRIKQAEIENEVAKLQNAQGIVQAEIAQQQIQFEVQRIKLQIEMVKLKAQEIKDDEQRAAKIREINATERQTLALAKEMVSSGNKRLETAREIARQKDIVADNILRGKRESIEAERVEARRAAKVALLARATGEAADEAARLNSNMSIGSTTTQTMGTSLPIDPDVQKAVIERAGPFGYRSVAELIRKLEEAQRIKNAQTARNAEMSQPSSSSFASASSYAPRSDSRGGGGTATVNVSTGPVMQVENKRYVSMEDFESGLREVARSTAQTSRSYGSRRYSGIGR